MRTDDEGASWREDPFHLLHPREQQRLGQMREDRQRVNEIEVSVRVGKGRSQRIHVECRKAKVVPAPADGAGVVIAPMHGRVKPGPVANDAATATPEVEDPPRPSDGSAIPFQDVDDALGGVCAPFQHPHERGRAGRGPHEPKRWNGKAVAGAAPSDGAVAPPPRDAADEAACFARGAEKARLREQLFEMLPTQDP
jgi:hypothetical protein